ncbi:tetratricopeptide repeat protein [Campylobacter hyointestinalis]|uniref:tetratricopeptide repeat protein n=1 Tax=Campylobacter hyointestinalis TaxID=198 RepID=UPI001BD40D44|nr:GTP pyrophosphokinase [Campylobacter hyointestinalis]MBT0611764.1 GTP pyrophosphokinase [Campylobacter hyointestinalis subsp. hyointestinalis]MDY2999304.1 GTP pyrophosphokinase [Campylobacter hyointestinalis]
MTDEQKEEVVILEKDDENSIVPLEELETKEEPVVEQKVQNKKNNFLMFGLIGGGAFILFLILVLVLLFKNNGSSDKTPKLEPPKTVKQTEIKTFSPSKIDDMLKKANKLYESGNKFEALKIYENVAIYNEALSNYNLGVSQMNQYKFKDALESFKKAITNQENTSVSALNAAVCALELNEIQLFKYYIDIANAFLAGESDSSLYAYYNAIINYYKGYYIEALNILENAPTNKYYENQKNYLRAKILSYLYLDSDSIKALNKVDSYDVNLPLGLLEARSGNYEIAKKYLNKALVDEKNANLTKLAIALINLKTGEFAQAGMALKDINEKNETFASSKYPIKAALNPELFDLNIAQNSFDLETFFSINNIYEMLFYFAPYKVFDAKQTMDYIRKGGISLFLDENNEADEYLKASRTLSKANLNLSKAIAVALDYNLREANSQLLNITKLYTNHSILHYNLALTYAQLGNFSESYKHFITSYHLDPKNHLSGVFAIVTSTMINKENKKLIAEVIENLDQDGAVEDRDMYHAIIQLTLGNKGALLNWLENDKSKNVLNIAFGSIARYLIGKNDTSDKKTEQLKTMLPNDILVNILNFTSKFDKNNIKEYAKDIQYNFFNNKLNKESLYGGANIIRVSFTKLLQISGLLNVQRDRIKKDLELTNDNHQNIMQTLAYLDLFTNNYEEAYTIYNDLIDNYNMRDSNSLFLASVASIGANHPESAIGYLRLSKIIDPTSKESIFALGLLYQEVGNIDAAITQYISLGDSDFKSEFFTFNLVD